MSPRKRSTIFALLMASVGILATGWYLGLHKKGVISRQYKLMREQLKGKLLYSDRQILTQKDVDSVTGFVFFIGSARSGHSIIGSMLDAHPDAVVAHEYNLFNKMASMPKLVYNRTRLYSALIENAYTQAARGWRSRNQTFARKGYDLSLGKQRSWQGRFRTLQVIGDKSGGKTVRLFSKEKLSFLRLYRSLSESVNVPIKVIHVVRNPYDMISTSLMYRFSKVRRQKANYSSTHPLDKESHVSQVGKVMYEESKAVSSMIEMLNLTVLEVHYMDFVNDTEKVMRELCVFLGLQCSQDYINMCKENTFKGVSITRHSVVWSQASQHFIKTKLLPIPFFSRYSFQSD